MHPSSMTRSPSEAFSPVVSVSSTTVRIGLPDRLDAEVREGVGALVLGVPRVPLYPVPGDAVGAGHAVKVLPQVDVLHRFLVGGAPAAPLPVGEPLADAL